ncbi:hypothetical protein QTI24_00055 [Variovorax sp. J22P240]|uniref:hypothetical protein n=1 Tax=Variovorax sp. J22P240 TaxID=3053514 RepID=UPI0025785225|nr:hypothetical protein [Variovorax sp. J22P240]MDL9996974.1 hypothetical protein [Variovorax sp. J22P240]
MKFMDLATGDRFRFFRRGLLLAKDSRITYSSGPGHSAKADPSAEVLPEVDDEPVAKDTPPADPFGARNRVDFQQGYVRLDGSFTEVQLEAVLIAMKGKP